MPLSASAHGPSSLWGPAWGEPVLDPAHAPTGCPVALRSLPEQGGRARAQIWAQIPSPPLPGRWFLSKPNAPGMEGAGCWLRWWEASLPQGPASSLGAVQDPRAGSSHVCP